MKKVFLLTTLVITTLSSVVFPLAASVGAVSPNQNAAQALEIAPPVVNLSGNPGETVKTQISLRDVSDSALVVKGQANDFIAAGEDGTPKLLLDDGADSPYSMKTWFAPLDQLTLKSKQIENLTVTINIPQNAAPGGYYSVIRFTATPPDLDTSGVSLSASLGALILLQVKGAAKESMKIEEFYTEKGGKRGTFVESAPVTFIVRMKNDGSVHEQPVGQIAIKNMFGQPVANVNVNLERHNVLPGSIRRFESPLDETVIGNKILFGRYTAQLTETYGTNGTKITQTISFWVIPWKIILAIIVVLVGIFLIIRLSLKRYRERILSQARRRRR